MLDELTRTARAEMDTPWDELREQRVLQRTLTQLDAPVISSGRTRRFWPMVVATAAVAAAAVIGGALALRPTPEPTESVATARTHALTPAVKPNAPDTSVLRLRDGSVVTLSAGAHVEVVTQTAEDVSLRQTTGRVVYSVPEVSGRSVRVEASDTVITAVIAVFTAQMETDGVTISVESGSVEVVSAERTLQLRAGEQATLNASESHPPAPVSPTPTDRKPLTRVQPTVEQLMQISDEARRARRPGTAADALRRIPQLYPDDPRVPTALFTLGRVERDRGRLTAAARAFERCHRAQRKGPLAADALAGAASAWMAADRPQRAHKAAKQYLETFPGGLHTQSMLDIMR